MESMKYWCPEWQTLVSKSVSFPAGCGTSCIHVEPASLDTKRLLEPTVATPTKIRGVALPDEPDVESNVTKETPILSLLYPVVSVGSGT